MKSFFIGLMMLISSFGVSQTWVSDYSISYKDVNGEWVKQTPEFESNTFVICNGDLVWLSDRIVSYSIIDIIESDEDTKYIVKGRDNYVLSFNVREKDVTLMFKAQDDNYYAIYFKIASEYKKF